ncbi:MAG: sigma-70 family RNA polymerase sigma factor [Christensenellaceae bacterium]
MNNKVVICGIDTSNIKRLTKEQQRSELKKIKMGDKVAKDNFIMSNIKLVLAVSKKFNKEGVFAEDLFQAGCIGLVKATDNFDESFMVQFSTYAVPMIEGEIKRFLRAKNSLRVSRNIRDMAYRALKARSELEKQNEAVTVEDISRSLNVDKKEVVFALDAISDPVSLYDPVYNNQGDEIMLVDQIADEKNTVENWTEKVALRTAIKNLGERERKILYLRYYIGKTQTEISEEIGLSQAQVSRLEKNALKTMKSKMS